jgi:hypothetical protein
MRATPHHITTHAAIADRIGVDEQDRVATCYTGLLPNVYCHPDAFEQARSRRAPG